jgi:hypothetical protein
MTITLTDEQERDLLEAYGAADHMPQGTMTGAQWAVFAKLHIAVGRIVDATFEAPSAAPARSTCGALAEGGLGETWACSFGSHGLETRHSWDDASVAPPAPEGLER